MTETTFRELVDGGHLTFGDGYRTRSSELAPAGYRILRAGDLHSGRVHFDGPDFVSTDFSRAIGSKIVKAGDVALTTKGTVGRVALVSEVEGEAVYSPQICFFRTPDASILLPRFLMYWLMSPSFLGQASYLMAATDMAPYLSLKDIASLKIAVPDLATQTAIAEVLGSLDDKIAANERVLRALDELVRVEAERWANHHEVRSLGELAAPITSKWDAGSETVPYLGLEHLPRRLLWASGSGTSEEVTSAKTVFAEGDLLFGKLRPKFHKVVVANGSGVCSTDIIVMRAREPEFRGWLWAVASSDRVVEQVSAHATGTRMPRANWTSLSAVEVPWPGSEEAVRASQLIESLNERAKTLIAESSLLAAIRDALLPELISGRLSVGGSTPGSICEERSGT